MCHDPMTGDTLREECGVFGVYGNEQAGPLNYYGLHALQHRGQESAGIAWLEGEQLRFQRGMGLVQDVFPQRAMDKIRSRQAIGHVRYATNGHSHLINAQPLVFNYRGGTMALAHNGSLTNASQIKRYLERQGSIFQTTSDTEVIAHLIARSAYDNLEWALREALSMIKGAYALLIMQGNTMMAALDPHGLRPLSLGRLGSSWVLASETCAFEAVGAEYVREVEPGELVIIHGEGLRSVHFTQARAANICSFEYIYFARPDSNVHGLNVHQARKRLGAVLAEEAPVSADVVTGVPDSSISAAIGYAETSKIPYELGLIKNRYVGRTFIQPDQNLRDQGVRMKLSAVRKVVEGQRVVMIDDSIVRGTTMSRLVQLLKEAGAAEVHVRISSPPVSHPCYYGIDTSDRDELIVAHKSLAEIEAFLGADSLSFLSVDGLLRALGRGQAAGAGNGSCGLCLACFNGEYPTEIFPEVMDSVEVLT